MTDQVFQISTLYGDVAGLAQGYINRADGERILLPLPEPCGDGEGVRFVVLLADGTPAFAGAGRCVQQSDQGGTVPPAERFETLVDTLQFDERSQPVYDYIVAVRNAAYAQGTAEEVSDEEVAEEVDDVVEEVPAEQAGHAGLEAAPIEEAFEAEEPQEVIQVVEEAQAEPEPEFDPEPEIASDLEQFGPQGAAHARQQQDTPEQLPSLDFSARLGVDEPTEYRELDARAVDAAAVAAEQTPVSHYDDVDTASGFDASDVQTVDADYPGADEREQVLVEGVPYDQAPAQRDVMQTSSFEYAAPAEAAYGQPAVYEQAIAQPEEPQTYSSFVPAPIPTGILTRPALAVHWSPAPARRPTPRPASGMFQYNGQGLPRPAAPPTPALDPSLWVMPAPRPSGDQPAAGAAIAATAPVYDEHAAPEHSDSLEIAGSAQASEPPLVSVAPDELEFGDDEDQF